MRGENYRYLTKKELERMREAVNSNFLNMPSNIRVQCVQNYGVNTTHYAIAWYLFGDNGLCARIFGVTADSFRKVRISKNFKACVELLKPFFDHSNLKEWVELRLVGIAENGGKDKFRALKLLNEWKLTHIMEKRGSAKTPQTTPQVEW